MLCYSRGCLRLGRYTPSMDRVSDDVDVFVREASRTDDLTRLDEMIREALPGVERVLWRGTLWGGTDQTIVGYGTITQSRPRGASVDWFLVGLAEQQNHLSVYVNAAEDDAYLVQARAARLGKVKTGAAAINFRSVADLDSAEFRSLLERARELELPE